MSRLNSNVGLGNNLGDSVVDEIDNEDSEVENENDKRKLVPAKSDGKNSRDSSAAHSLKIK